VIITIHRSTRAIFHGAKKQQAWDEWSFQPNAQSCITNGRWLHLHGQSTPELVNVPIGSRIIERAGRHRLTTHFDSHGIEAAAVHFLANAQQYGMRIQSPAATPQIKPPETELEDDDEEPETVGYRVRGGRRNGSYHP
jgi:hypothetical protein